MTPIIGWLAAIIVGLLATSRRQVLLGVLTPLTAAGLVQTWGLWTGRGNNPPSTVHGASYYVVQLIIFGLFLGVAAEIFAVRRRRAERGGVSIGGVDLSGPRAAVALVAGFVISLAITVGLWALTRPAHPGGGNGSPPWYGVAGIGLAALFVVVVGLGLVATRRRSSKTSNLQPEVVR